ncbi:MAG: gliding motility-associated C-terminal domain-containing protein [Bacteroidia bacterium]
MKISTLIFVTITLMFTSITSAQSWVWAKQGVVYSAASNGASNGLATDIYGNVYMTGNFEDTLSFGADTLIEMSRYFGSAFLVKYDATGNLIWAKQAFPQSTQSMANSNAIAVDASGDIYITGVFQDTVMFDTCNLCTLHEAQDVFLIKYDMNGKVLWAKQGISSVFAFATSNSVSLDASGNIYITGAFQDTVKFGGYSLSTAYQDVFLVKYDMNGNVLWAKQTQSSYTNIVLDDNAANSVSIDKFGNSYITGGFDYGTITFGTTTLNSYNTNGEVFLAKFDPKGNVLWARQSQPASLGGGPGYGSSVAVDINNKVYVTGDFWGHVSFGPFTLTTNVWDIFLIKYDSGGTVIWAEAANYDSIYNYWYANTIATDTLNHVYFTASSEPGWYPLIIGGDTFTSSPNSYSTALIKFDSSGKVICGSVIKGATNTFDVSVGSLAVDSSGSYVYDAGSLAFSITIGPDKLYYEWNNSPWIARWSSCCPDARIKGNLNLCKGDSTTLTAGGGISYKWSTGATTSSITIKPDSSASYQVIASNGFCSDSINKTITVTPYPIPGINTPPEICGAGNSAQLLASGGASYIWEPSAGLNSDTIPNPVADPATTTLYTVTIANKECKVSDSVKVKVVTNVPQSVLCCDTLIMFDQSINLTSTTGAGSIIWTPSIGLNCDTCPSVTAEPSESTTYMVTITNDSGCSITRSITIHVDCGTVFIPGAFSPNGDGQNDRLYVRGPCINTIDFIVFDRWGNKVFETYDKNNGWDGTYKGLPMNAGTYVYTLTAKLNDGTMLEKKGNVALVR